MLPGEAVCLFVCFFKKAMELGKCRDRASFESDTVQCYMVWPHKISRFCKDPLPMCNSFQFWTPDLCFFPVILPTALLSFSSWAIPSILNSLPWLFPSHMPRDLGPPRLSLCQHPVWIIDGGEEGSLETSPLWKSCQAAVLQTAACKQFNIYAPCTDTE